MKYSKVKIHSDSDKGSKHLKQGNKLKKITMARKRGEWLL